MRFEAADALRHDIGAYDVVILSDVLEHIPNCGDFMKKISTAMKPGARFLLTVPNGWGNSELMLRPSYFIKPSPVGKKIVKLIKRILRTKDVTTANEETPHVNFFSLGRLKRLFAENGLQFESFYGFFHYWTLWETFFSERKVPADWPKNDFLRSFQLGPGRCAEWAFLLKKEAPKAP
jgi:2-polyprenyl-3-methyl-5-hydroxy-6-metoxy-1,4-benzoquinol methylase